MTMPIIELAIAVYFIGMPFVITTNGAKNALILQAVPFLSGMFLGIDAMVRLGFMIQV